MEKATLVPSPIVKGDITPELLGAKGLNFLQAMQMGYMILDFVVTYMHKVAVDVADKDTFSPIKAVALGMLIKNSRECLALVEILSNTVFEFLNETFRGLKKEQIEPYEGMMALLLNYRNDLNRKFADGEKWYERFNNALDQIPKEAKNKITGKVK